MITYRDKQLSDTILKTDIQQGDLRYIVAEPGDCTRYELLITSVDNATADTIGVTRGSLIVTLLNLGGHPRSMFLYPDKLSWKDVRDGLSLSAEGSCYFITALIAWIYPGFSCASEEEFYESYMAEQKRKEKNRKSRA
jgi:hypothetical protein